MDKQKVYVFILTYYLGGGTERVFENVASALHSQESDAEIYLYVVHGFEETNFILDDYVKIVHSYSSIRKIVLLHHNKIVINFSGDWKSGIVARSLSKKYISWVHCNPFTMHTARSAVLNFHLLRKSNKIVCVCHEQKEILQNEFSFRNNITVIYNSVDSEKIKELSCEPLTCVSNSYILMVARIDFASKDFFTVIDAYENLREKLKSKYKLLFLGDGPDKQKVLAYISKKHLEDFIILAGFDKNPYRWMKNAACNILSSKNEGFSVSCIESMSLGCPQIVTNYQTGAKEIACGGKTAAIVEIGDVEGLSDSITKILTDNDYRNNLVKNASAFVEQFYQNHFEREVHSFFKAVENDFK